MHARDYGGTITLTIQESGSAKNVSTATGVVFILRSPTGVRSQHTASNVSDGSDGQVRITVAKGTLNESGGWKVQAKVTFASSEYYSDWAEFQVKPNL